MCTNNNQGKGAINLMGVRKEMEVIGGIAHGRKCGRGREKGGK